MFYTHLAILFQQILEGSMSYAMVEEWSDLVGCVRYRLAPRVAGTQLPPSYPYPAQLHTDVFSIFRYFSDV